MIYLSSEWIILTVAYLFNNIDKNAQVKKFVSMNKMFMEEGFYLCVVLWVDWITNQILFMIYKYNGSLFVLCLCMAAINTSWFIEVIWWRILFVQKW